MRIFSSGPAIINNTKNGTGDVFSSYTNGTVSNLGTQAISGYSSGANTIGVFGQSNNALGFGMKAFNSDSNGTALIAGGNNESTISIIANGGGGAFAGVDCGLFTYATDPNVGTGIAGVVAAGNNFVPPDVYPSGSGGAFTGNYCGVFGVSKQQSASGSYGGVFSSKNFGYYVNVAGWFLQQSPLTWIQVKIMGPGVASTIADGLNNDDVVLFCPEAPEVLFQDKGVGQLLNGKAHITLDPILSKNILVDGTHPLSVLIQPEGDCKGVYITNKTGTGFDVTELQNGTSDIKFTWFVMATRADKTYTNKDGSTITSSYSKVRFPIHPPSPEPKELKVKTIPLSPPKQ